MQPIQANFTAMKNGRDNRRVLSK